METNYLVPVPPANAGARFRLEFGTAHEGASEELNKGIKRAAAPRQGAARARQLLKGTNA